jgi:hypothetical protein
VICACLSLSAQRLLDQIIVDNSSFQDVVGHDSVYDELAIALGSYVQAPELAGISDHFDPNHRELRVLYVGGP